MKKVLKLCAIMLVVISCNEEQPLTEEQSLIQSFLVSKSFIDLGVDASELNLKEVTVKIKSNGIRSISMPCNGKLKYVFGNALVKEDAKIEFISAYSFKYITDLNYEDLTEELNSKNYTGKLEIKLNKATNLLVSVNQGKFTEASGRSNQTCRGGVGSNQWTQDVADCASSRIDRLNWFDYTYCILTIAECWAQTVISCIVDDCIVQEP